MWLVVQKALSSPSADVDLFHFAGVGGILTFLSAVPVFLGLEIAHAVHPAISIDAAAYVGAVAGLAGAYATVIGAVAATFRIRGEAPAHSNGQG
jgi:hypothetical protein